jgi:serine/threonine-protein kinase
MTDDSQILGLVQEILDTNRSPEEVCADHPELLGEVRRRLNRVRRVSYQLDAIFPTSGSGTSSVANEKRRLSLNGELPQIPGYEVESVLGGGGMSVIGDGSAACVVFWARRWWVEG